jgi:hypothetical protein
MILVKLQESVSREFLEKQSFVIPLDPEAWAMTFAIVQTEVVNQALDADPEERRELKRWGIRKSDDGSRVELVEVITREEPEWQLSVKEKSDFFKGVVFGVIGDKLVVLESLFSSGDPGGGEVAREYQIKKGVYSRRLFRLKSGIIYA